MQRDPLQTKRICSALNRLFPVPFKAQRLRFLSHFCCCSMTAVSLKIGERIAPQNTRSLMPYKTKTERKTDATGGIDENYRHKINPHFYAALSDRGDNEHRTGHMTTGRFTNPLQKNRFILLVTAVFQRSARSLSGLSLRFSNGPAAPAQSRQNDPARCVLPFTKVRGNGESYKPVLQLQGWTLRPSTNSPHSDKLLHRTILTHRFRQSQFLIIRSGILPILFFNKIPLYLLKIHPVLRSNPQEH